MKRALFSLYKKDGCEEFARFLHSRGYEILSTGGTYRHLKQVGIPVTEVGEATGFPEVLDGRVKTLHPTVHAGILAMRGNPEHMKQIADRNIPPIDFVVVNLYPFEETVKNPASKFEDIIEQIDIGGVALIRAAGKNWQDVAIVVDNGDFAPLQEEFAKTGILSRETRLNLAGKAFSHTAYYDGLISGWFNGQASRKFPEEMAVPMKLAQGLRYGENPHQDARLYRSGTEANISTLNAEILWGKEMSYNNFMDADACLDIVREFASDAPFCTIIKHANPCGSALGKTLADAFVRARSVDPDAAFGGIAGFNRRIDNETAKKIVETFFEIVLAPGFDDDALETLKNKKNLRILKLNGTDWSKKGLAFRKLEGGFLVQDWDGPGSAAEKFEVPTKKAPTESEKADLDFAWKIAKYVKSNAIVFAKDGLSVGVGAGQMKRVDSVRIACMHAQEFGFDIHGAVMASDAFFPFRDSVDQAAKEGLTAIIQPGGSKNDQQSIDAANEHGMSMVFTGNRHFRH
jgi:phosphoribosylaminoimidazolecarboxamide formyltransferase/IMP cyclohydrolase